MATEKSASRASVSGCRSGDQARSARGSSKRRAAQEASFSLLAEDVESLEASGLQHCPRLQSILLRYRAIGLIGGIICASFGAGIFVYHTTNLLAPRAFPSLKGMLLHIAPPLPPPSPQPPPSPSPPLPPSSPPPLPPPSPPSPIPLLPPHPKLPPSPLPPPSGAPRPPPSLPPTPPPPWFPGSAHDLTIRLNAQWYNGRPSDTVHENGVLVRQFDKLDDSYNVRPWMPCPQDQWCAKYGDRWATSVINKDIRKLYFHDEGGLVLSSSLKVLCVHQDDGNSMAEERTCKSSTGTSIALLGATQRVSSAPTYNAFGSAASSLTHEGCHRSAALEGRSSSQ